MIAIISAMEIENEAILALCKDVKEKNISHKKFYEATLSDEKVVLCLSGVGKINAAISTTLLLEHFPIDYIFNIGTAGGLKEEEKVLDCVISSQVVEHDYDTSPLDGKEGKGVFFDADPLLIDITKNVAQEMKINYHVGLVASGDQFVTSSSCDKILADFPESMCAEMEAGGVSQVATHYGVPFVIIRSLSDIAHSKGNHMVFSEYVQKASQRSALFCEKCVERVYKR
ncbi:MAG: 5'-methylthioadenosine/adenosylhomocysteine nucleosidase [Traorella sp.]